MAQLGERETEEQHEHQQHVGKPEPSMIGGAGAESAFDSTDHAADVSPFGERGMRGASSVSDQRLTITEVCSAA